MRLVIQIVVLGSLVTIRLLIHLLLRFFAALKVVGWHRLCPAQLQLPALSATLGWLPVIRSSCIPFVRDLPLIPVILTFDSELMCDSIVDHTRRHLLVLRVILELSRTVVHIKHLLVGACHVIFIFIDIGIVVVAVSQFKWIGVLRLLLLLELQLLWRMHLDLLKVVSRACGRARVAAVALLLTRIECGSLRRFGRQGGLR